MGLKRHVSLEADEQLEFARKLSEAGQPRAPGTVRAWILQTHTVAPMNYRTVVPLIARLTEDGELNAELAGVLQSIDLIYRARSRAAEAIVRELFAGEIDLDSDELCFKVGASKVLYTLYRVNRLAGIQEVPVEMIGKVARLGVGPTREPIETPA
jgi:hypothetical protein